jgi:anti-sigma factor RsiW
MKHATYLTPEEAAFLDSHTALRDECKRMAAAHQREIDLIRDRARKRAAKEASNG